MRRLLLPLLPAALMSLAGCAAMTGTAGTEPPPEAADPGSVCLVWLPISWSAGDTDQTIREVKANNRAQESWCGPS